MKQIDPLGAERTSDVILWHISYMGGWLHLLTVLLAMCKWMGLIHVTWVVVFVPSLLYGVLLILLAVGGHSLFALGRWINAPDLVAPFPISPPTHHVAREKEAASIRKPTPARPPHRDRLAPSYHR